MWGKKRPDTPRAADLEPKNSQTNQPPKPPPAVLEGLARTGKDAMLSTEATTRLGPSLHVKGEMSGNEDLLIDGSVEGLIQIDERKLTIGTAAKVTADIIAGAVVVYGNVKGNVRAKDRIEIKKDGAVAGDLTTPQIMIEVGAYFKGSIEIERGVAKEAEKNASARTASAAKAAGAGSDRERSTPMSIPTRLKGFLDENQIPYSALTHAAVYTAQGAAATMQISGKGLAKTVVLWAGEEMILAVLPTPNHVRLDKLGAELGKSVRLATEQEFSSLFPDCELGAMPLSALFTTCPCMWMSRWPPMTRLSSMLGRTAMRFACGMTTLFVWPNPGSARLLRKGDASDLVVFLGG